MEKRKKKINLNETIVIAIISLFSSILVGMLSTFLSSNFLKNNEIETRVFEIKKGVYEAFLGEYFNNFNNNILRERYEANFENIIAFNLNSYCGIGRSDLVLKNINYVKQDLEQNILKCYYEYPSRCSSNTCYGQDYKEIPGFSLPESIGSAQNEAMKETINELFFDFKKSTYKYQLLLPPDIYEKIFTEIQQYIYLSPNSYNDCNGETSPECGFNFDDIDINGKIDVLVNENILQELRDDLQKHY